MFHKILLNNNVINDTIYSMNPVRNKKIIFLCLTLICGLIFGGCKHVYELSEEDERQIAIYCARATSKYNRTLQQGAVNIRDDSGEGATTRSRIFDDVTASDNIGFDQDQSETDGGDGINDIPEPISGDTSTGSDTGSDMDSSGATDGSGEAEGLISKNAPGIGHALGMPELKFSFVKAQDVTNYSFDGYFDLSPSAGNHFLVLEYEVFNSSDEDIELNVPDLGVSFRATVDGAANTSDRTILLNDLSNFNGTIKSHKKQDMVLLFQFAPQYIKDLSNIQLQVISGEEKTLVEMR